MLAGQSCRHQASIAHSGLGVDVVGVREQLDGQGYSVLRYGVCCMGLVDPSISHLWGDNHHPWPIGWG